jgi:hypothetical protein
MHLNYRRPKPYKESGAYMMEFAIVSMLLFLFTIVTIHFAFYFAIWGIIEKGCHNGISLATKAPGVGVPEDEDDIAALIKEEIIAEAKNYPERSGLMDSNSINISITLPGTTGHPLFDDFANQGQREPSELLSEFPIMLTCSVRPSISIPFFGIDRVTAVAFGFQ